MVIVHLSGGFGNQLFSYAFGYAMAQKRNDILAIDTAIQDAPWFFRNPDILNLNIKFDERISYQIGRTIAERAVINKIRFRSNIGWKTKYIREGELGQGKYLEDFAEYSKSFSNIYLKGNWVSEKYFENVRDEIQEMFTFQKPLGDEAEKIQTEILNCPSSVTIHCRRGDYIRLGACITADYFTRAMEYMDEHIEHPVFYCFSEEQEWAMQSFNKLPYDIRYPQYHSEDKGLEDFRLLMSGKHQIIANSTYSWWAAYLNPNPDKIIVTPTGGICDKDFCLNEWIKFPYETE